MSRFTEVGDRRLKVAICFNMEEEIWKDVIGYEGHYKVSNYGRVLELERVINGKKKVGGIKRLYYDSKKYLFLWLRNNDGQKMFRVHRLVALAFIPRVEGKVYIDHINGIRDDNRVENLRWCTHKENDGFPLSRLHRSISHKGKQSSLGRRLSEETKKKISKAHLGIKNPNYWNSLSEENKMKIRKAGYEACRVEVEQLTLDGIIIKKWESMTAAAKQLGVFRTNISKCCRGENKTCGGYKWRYCEK